MSRKAMIVIVRLQGIVVSEVDLVAGLSVSHLDHTAAPGGREGVRELLIVRLGDRETWLAKPTNESSMVCYGVPSSIAGYQGVMSPGGGT